MKKRLLLLFLLPFLASCVTEDYMEETSLDFIPRKAYYAWMIPGKLVNGHYQSLQDKDSTGVPCSQFFMEIVTSNQQLASPSIGDFGDTFQTSDFYRISGLEEQIEYDYFNDILTRMNLVTMEYRTDAVEALEITADQTLFGVPAGQSLNDYLDIVRYEPYYICGSNGQLLYGKGTNDKPTRINDWLALDPLAQPSMDLMFQSVPDELPQEVSFTVTLRKDIGQELSYTLSPLTLLAE